MGERLHVVFGTGAGGPELAEMMYEVEEPFVVGSSRFEERFGVRATPLDEALAATVDRYRGRPSRSRWRRSG
jgi:hypothetical protein